MKRTFLDWSKPFIPSLVEHLLSQCRLGDSSFFDLSQYVLVFPNRAASKRFLTVLADYAWRNDCTIEPPRVKHMGDFMELLYEQKAPCASLLTQQVIWMQAFKQTAMELPELFKRVFPNAPGKNDMESWFQIGKEMANTFLELARENLNFTQVFNECRNWVPNGEETEMLPEKESVPSANGELSELDSAFQEEKTQVFFPYHELCRWQLFAEVERIYFQRLDELGLWDRQAARLFALRNSESAGNGPSKDFQISFRLGIVGCVDLSSIQREFLKKVSSQVEIFIFAPESWSSCFELDGSLKPGAWRRMDPALNEKLHANLVQAVKPEDQVQEIIEWLRDAAKEFSIEEVTLGLVDESLEPLLLQALSLANVPMLRAGKKTLADLQPWKLLKQTCDYFQSVAAFQPGVPLPKLMETVGPEYATLALFLRQEDIGNYLRSLRNAEGEPLINGNWIEEMDAFFNASYPSRLPLPNDLGSAKTRFPAFWLAYTVMHQLLADLVKEFGNFHTLLTFVTQYLKKIYCWKPEYDSQNEVEYQIIRGCMELNHSFSDKLQLPTVLLEEFQPTLPQALNLLLQETGVKQMVSSNVPETISIQRWLDLPLDDAPAMAILGANEEFIPAESVTEHIILPNQLRQKLKIKTNESRFERDMYNLSAILASRKNLKVTFGRISTDSRPLRPSRLLLTEASERLIDQVISFFDEPQKKEDSKAEEETQKILSADSKSAEVTKSEENENLAEPVNPAAAEKKIEAETLTEAAQILAELPHPRHMAVTHFGAYLSNPYAFYLQNILKLSTADDFAKELSNADFGNLLHAVVEAFALEEIENRKNGRDINPASLLEEKAFQKEIERIQNRFTELLNRIFLRKYAPFPFPVVEIQKEQLAERLRVFAERQAERYRDGWKIWGVECPIASCLRENAGRGDVILFGTEEPAPMFVSGKIDRIDFRVMENGKTEWCIWDYKTFETSLNCKYFGSKKVPENLDESSWKDLQLPLYYHLLRAIRNDSKPEFAELAKIDSTHLKVGYILLPKKTENISFNLADWDEKVWQSAEKCIARVAHEVHDKKFPNPRTVALWDHGTEMEWILKDGQN